MSSESPMSDPKQEAKPYEAPKMIRVSLRPDEAVLGHCKTPSSRGPAALGCGIAVGGCMAFGS
ncbi:MAG: hypothetical protein WCA00_00490 [Candidatus Acidiferrales bacterium]